MRRIIPFVLILFALPPVQSHAEEPRPWISLKELREKYDDPTGQVIKIEDIEVYYRDEGVGPVLLMVHGSASSLASFDPLVAKLRHRFRIIRYDVPGQGLSGPVTDDAAHRLSPAEIPERLLSKLGLKDVTLVGVSSGGTLCVYLAARRPDLVKRLILSNMPADPVDTSHMKQPDSFIEAQRQARATGFQSEQFWNEFLAFFFGDAGRITPSIRQQFYDVNRRVPDHNALSLVAKVADHEQAVAMMGQVSAPTLLLWGARDPLLPASAARVLAGYLTQAPISILMLPDVGHFPPIEVPDRFADIVALYIDDVTP